MKKKYLFTMAVIDVVLIIIVNHFFDRYKWMSIVLFMILVFLALNIRHKKTIEYLFEFVSKKYSYIFYFVYENTINNI